MLMISLVRLNDPIIEWKCSEILVTDNVQEL